ncbi:DUF934 domain-containing protein [Aquincola sp. S2]|uniref:DUF934 domain-containing protein n=1 Tax=Pseudaquabacterium terrae TaxID=2732868 RepID=A0ABX2EK30_9BURK|nr:DUF934 domain-containing protein [Aquabacterium terrae]NRF68973.1 DUF934 domain-containing protein [Aquabacterium terrae]
MKFIESPHDQWHVAGGEDGPIQNPAPRAFTLLSLEQWHAVRESWPAGLATGVIVPNDTDIETLAADLPRLSLIALQFPKWIDGRAYSQARLLRSRYRFAGEVRATGDVVVDMLPLLQRTGFDAVKLRHDQKVDSARRALNFFAGHYQGDVNQRQPAFARDVASELQAHAQRQADQFVGEGI